jgi:filamentous hemagglutinin
MNLESRNRLELALLGPVFGAPSTVAILNGAAPETVALTNQVGVIAYELASSGHVLGPKSPARSSRVEPLLQIRRELGVELGFMPRTQIGLPRPDTKYSANQVEVYGRQIDAIRVLENSGWAKNLSADGTVTIMTKADRIYRFYPKATSTGEPSAELRVLGQRKPVAKLRFKGGV